MTDLLDPTSTAEVLEDPSVAHAERATQIPTDAHRRRRASGSPFELSVPWSVLLATLSAAAGAIHLAMVPSHWTESPIEGAGFSVAGWSQIAIAGLLIARPRRRVLHVAIVLNVGFIAVWAASRVWGLPIGAHAGHPEQVSAVDLTCVAFQAALIVGCLCALVRPKIGAAWTQGTLVMLSILPVALVVATTAVIASPSVHDHAQESLGTESSASGLVTDGHDHANDTTDSAAAPAGNAPGAAAAPAGHQHAGSSGNADEQAELQPDVPLDATTQKQLGDQLVVAREASQKYPTVHDAKAAGMFPAGGTGPGFGAHYMALAGQFGATGAAFDPSKPSSYIYASTDDDAPIVGLMYTAMTNPSDGFAGPNDHWHRHSNVCLTFTNGQMTVPFPVDTDVTKAQCDGVGGRYMQTTVWMVHAWVVPGWESPKGVFSHDNPNVHCPDGTDNADSVGACLAQR